MVYKYTFGVIPIFLLILGAPILVNASMTDEELQDELDNMCDANPNDSFCIERNNDRDCENPPSAASCNNDEDAHGVSSSTSKFDEPTGCYKAGYKDGQNGPFDTEIYHDNCEGKGKYYDGFIDGCMSEGNTRDVCESATDAK